MLTKSIKIIQFLHSLPRQLFSVQFFLAATIAIWGVFMVSSPAQAAVDEYVRRFLDVTEPIALDLDGKGQTQQFSAEDISAGKELFKSNCISCHVRGATLPYPPVSLALNALANATPPRDNINGIVNYLRQPMTYDGSEETFWCRQVPETWLSQEQIENLAAFIIRAAQKAPGWGSKDV